jgi:hypothetical protein
VFLLVEGFKQTTYQARFVPFEGYVVCDRLFTTVVRILTVFISLAFQFTICHRSNFCVVIFANFCLSLQSLVESLIGKNTVEHGTWDPRQPNRLELILRGGPKVSSLQYPRVNMYNLTGCLERSTCLSLFAESAGCLISSHSQRVYNIQSQSDGRELNHVQVENTVTKRSAGMFSPYEFESAEFSRQVHADIQCIP